MSDDGTLRPVALLFAGSSTQTIANRIDLVLNYFGVRVDGDNTPPPPPTPVTDVAITSVGAPASAIQGAAVNVVVTVKNVGNQPVGSFDVSLRDATDDLPIGTQTVGELAPGASATKPFGWATTSSSIGVHTLSASHNLTDDVGSNNALSATTTVNAPGSATGIHIGDLDGRTTGNTTTWSAIVEITVHDVNHNPLNGATVRAVWSVAGLSSNTCTTGDLGGNGSCIMLISAMKRSTTPSVTLRIQSATKAGQVYNSADNHDVDGGTNGTGIKVNRPQ